MELVMKYRILIADDHELVRLGITELLKKHTQLEICGEASDGREAMKKTQLLKPDILITDIGMPGMNGLIACNKILKDDPQQKILVFSAIESEVMIRTALSIGVRGLVLKTDPGSDLIEAVVALQQNRLFFSRQVDRLILAGYLGGAEEKTAIKQQTQDPVLSVRENEILQLLAEGKSSKEVAWLLGVSIKTVETHRTHVMRKLGIHRLPALVIYAIQQNIVEAPVTYESVAGTTPSAVRTTVSAAA